MKLYDLIAKEADQETALRMLNARGEVVGFYPRLAHAFGGVTHGLLLSQFMYWHGKETFAEGWVFKTIAEIETETGLTKREQQTARSYFKRHGLLEEKKTGMPPRNYYKFNWAKVVALLIGHGDGGNDISPDIGLRTPGRGIRKAPPLGEKGPNGGAKTHELYKVSETTAETTAENTQKKAPVGTKSSTSKAASKKEAVKPKEPDPGAIAVVQEMLDWIAIIPGSVPPNGNVTRKWLAELEELNRKEGVAWATMLETITFAQNSDFWRGKVLTVPKLRQHWNTLRSQIQEAQEGKINGKGSNGKPRSAESFRKAFERFERGDSGAGR